MFTLTSLITTASRIRTGAVEAAAADGLSESLGKNDQELLHVDPERGQAGEHSGPYLSIFFKIPLRLLLKKLLQYHPGILNKIPLKIKIPFKYRSNTRAVLE